MSATRPTRPLSTLIASLTACLGLGLSACEPGGGPDGWGGGPVYETNDDGGDWDTYRASAVEVETGFVAEGDLFFADEAALRDHFDAHHMPSGALVARVDAAGRIIRWPAATQHHIRYCLDASLGNFRAEAEAAFHAATGAWESRVDVNFFHDKTQDGALCTPQNQNVDFTVQLHPWNTWSFTPDTPRADRSIALWPDHFSAPAPCSLEGGVRHLIGHALGFMHVHGDGGIVDDGDGGEPIADRVEITSDDAVSVMYAFPPERCFGETGARQISPRDFQGAIQIYGEAKPADRLVGDFNGDGRTDVAMFRAGWGSLPVYFALANGEFSVTNFALADNLINTQPDATKLLGDFDGDGKTDILVADDQASPNTVIYYSDGSGVFTPVRRAQANGHLNDYASTPLVGRFNNDNRDDILVVRSGSNSTSVMLAPAARANAFTVVSTALPVARRAFNDPLAGRLLGDFDGDGLTDVALWREGLGATPMYFANGAGGWVMTSVAHAAHENWINDPATSKIVGRFGAANKAGILLSRPGWNTAPIYFSDSTAANRVGSFTKTNFAAARINDPMVVKLPGDFDGDQLTDVLMLDYDNPTAFRVLFAVGNGSYVDSSLSIMDWTFSRPEFNYATIRASNPIVGRFNIGTRSDVLLWRNGWQSNPILFGDSRLRVSATNVVDPFFNLMNDR